MSSGTNQTRVVSGGQSFGQADDGLDERHGFDGRPACGTSYAAGGAVRADDACGVQLFAASGGFHFEMQTA